MSGGFIFLQTILNNFFEFLFTTEIVDGLYLGWSFVYVILVGIILGLAFHG